MSNYYIGKKVPVNNQGWIMLCDVMGTDHDIAEAARTSYGKSEKDTHKDEHLIRYLMRHGHTSPFEMAELKFMVYVPMDVWRQWVRHRTASINEYSTRYSVAIDQMYEAPEWRLQDQGNKQGSDGLLDKESAEKLSEKEEAFHKAARELYDERIEMGVAREQARKDLPLSTFTQAYWKIDLKNLLNFLRLRCDKHAQKEIRAYADVIFEMVKTLFPLTWRAFVEYQREAITFSLRDQLASPYYLLNVVYTAMKAEAPHKDFSKFKAGLRELFNQFIPEEWKQEKSRERDEFLEKIQRLIQVPEGYGFDPEKIMRGQDED